jgi:NAD(P)H-hydrate epimerase
MKALLPELPCPAVLDADALSIVAENPQLLRRCSVPLVLTPHPGEMARLVQKSTREVQENRIDTALEFAGKHGVILVLKGHGTLVASPDGRLAVNSTGNPAMASGGMGDTLTGIIAGLLGQGLKPFEAASLGVYVHGAAGDEAFAEISSRGMTASDLLPMIPRVLGRIERGKGRPCTR